MARALAEAGTIRAGGRTLEYRRAGPPPGDAPTLVLLHEGLGCVAMWRDFPERLAEATGCAVVAYSRAGYGGSDPCDLPRPLTYMQEEGADVLPEVLDAIGADEVILIGHSDGASIAIVHAGAHADVRVKGLVLMAPHVFTEEMGLASIAAARVAYETTDLREKLAKYHGANVDCAFRGWNGAWLDPGFRDWNIEGYLGNIGVPVLVLQGEDDQYGTRAQVDAIARQSGGPVETVMLPACGHAPFKERPERTLAETARFVARVLTHAAPMQTARRGQG